MQRPLLAGLLIGTLALGGCVFAPGGDGDWDDDDNNGRDREPTVGQELIDLDRARDDGAITDAEYEQAKERILDSID